MRIALIAASASIGLIAGCSGQRSTDANNAAANMSAAAHPTATAKANVAAPVSMTPVTGDEAKTVMHERHEGMEAIGKAAKATKRALGESSPDLAAVRASAAKIADLSQKASGWFHSGTGPDMGKTGAKPAIWENQQDFASKLANFQKAAQAFDVAANGGDLTAIKARYSDLGGACKACHDKYRAEMHH
jgi:cytochrome c556